MCEASARGRKRSAVVKNQNMCKYIQKAELAARYQISLGTVKNMMRKRVLPYLKMVFRLQSHSNETDSG